MAAPRQLLSRLRALPRYHVGGIVAVCALGVAAALWGPAALPVVMAAIQALAGG